MADSPSTDDTFIDTETASMFGDDESSPSSGYLVLARKYRPRTFEDLVGQDVLVRTLSNAFRTGRIAHAYMLTGVRGVGKTTTARLLARALNYQNKASKDAIESKPNDEGIPETPISKPTIELNPLGEHCQAIMESRHPDVLELDAASRTGVADMRELLDGVRYAPVSAPNKVYIIDEVHMLSTASFNALLKTLEEPPPHAKFIFATTEIKKVPVTVLSRCQRFDLKRLSVELLTDHLEKICALEKAKIERPALELIARAAEGSARDALSILDQAIVQTNIEGPVDAETVRDMLGLADRTRLLDLYAAAVTGAHKDVLREYDVHVSGGADPTVLMKELMDISVDVNRAIVMGDEYTAVGPENWIDKTKAIASSLSPAQNNRFWQILLRGFEQASASPDPKTSIEMALLRMTAAATLPSPEDAARRIMSGEPHAEPTEKKTEPVGASADQGPASFDAILAIMRAAKKADLLYESERFVRPESVRFGFLTCDLATGAPEDFPARLKQFLEAQTEVEWQIDRVDSSIETPHETALRKKKERIERASQHPTIQAALAQFPGAVIEDVVEPDANAEGENIVEVDFSTTNDRKEQA